MSVIGCLSKLSLQIDMETVTSMGRMVSEEQREEEPSAEALQLVKSEERVEQEQAEARTVGGEGSRAASPLPHSVITSRRGVRTITAAGHICTEPEPGAGDDVKHEPPEPAPLDHEPPPHYAPKLEDAPDAPDAPPPHYDEERLRLAEADTARYLAFKQEPYRTLPSPAPGDKRLPPQYARAPQRPPYGRGISLRYGAPHHVIVGQEGEAEEHAHDAFLAHKDKEQLQVYATNADGSANGQDARHYAAVLGDQTAASTALEMIQTTSLSNQQAVGVAYQQVKYETRGEGEPRPTTYASLQPVTSVHGGYAYAGQSPQYGGAGYSAYAGGGKELLTLYGGGAPGPSTGPRGDESPPGQLMYRTDPTLSSSSLTARGAHVVYGSVVPQSQAVYEAPPSPNSQQVFIKLYISIGGICLRVRDTKSWLCAQVTLYTHGNAVQYKVGGEHYVGQGSVEYGAVVAGYEGGLLVEGYAAPGQAWPAHNLLSMDDGFDPGEFKRTTICIHVLDQPSLHLKAEFVV